MRPSSCGRPDTPLRGVHHRPHRLPQMRVRRPTTRTGPSRMSQRLEAAVQAFRSTIKRRSRAHEAEPKRLMQWNQAGTDCFSPSPLFSSRAPACSFMKSERAPVFSREVSRVVIIAKDMSMARADNVTNQSRNISSCLVLKVTRQTNVEIVPPKTAANFTTCAVMYTQRTLLLGAGRRPSIRIARRRVGYTWATNPANSGVMCMKDGIQQNPTAADVEESTTAGCA